MDDGLFAPGDPKMIEFAIMGAVNWISKWFDPAGPMTSDQIGQSFAGYLVGQLQAVKQAPGSSAFCLLPFRLPSSGLLRRFSRLQFQHVDARALEVCLQHLRRAGEQRE